MLRLTRVARPGSLIFLLSDFRRLGADAERHLRQLAGHCDLMLLHFFDPVEAELPPPGRYRIQSGTRTFAIETANDVLRRSYHERYAARVASLKALARLPGIHLIECATHGGRALALGATVSPALSRRHADQRRLHAAPASRHPSARVDRVVAAGGRAGGSPRRWSLAALVVLGLYYRSGRHRRAALRSVRKVHAALEQGAEPVACLQRVSTTLRRFAMTTADAQAVASLRAVDGVAERASSDEVAGMIGDRWLRYLDSRWQRDEFQPRYGRLLLAAPYARPATIERQHAIDLAALCAEWLKAQSVRRAGARRS